MATKMDMAEIIRKAFRRSKMSRLKLAEKTGLRYSAVYRFLEGGDMTLRSASRICEVLDLEPRSKRPRGKTGWKG